MVRTVLSWPVNVKCGISDWNIPTDAEAIAVATVQTSAVILYTLYDSSWSEDVSIVGCIVVLIPVK